VSCATAYRDEGLGVLAERAPDLHEALLEVAEQGWRHVVLDGTVVRSDRCAETTTSVKGETINSWYSGKHHAPGGNLQAVLRPDGRPIWVSEVAPGHRHDLTVARDAGVIGVLNRSASQLDPAHPGRLRLRRRRLRGQGADQAALQRAGPRPGQSGLQCPAHGHPLPRRMRLRPFTRRWRALQRVTVSLGRIGELA
jgi:hypothetical protein